MPRLFRPSHSLACASAEFPCPPPLPGRLPRHGPRNPFNLRAVCVSRRKTPTTLLVLTSAQSWRELGQRTLPDSTTRSKGFPPVFLIPGIPPVSPEKLQCFATADPVANACTRIFRVSRAQSLRIGGDIKSGDGGGSLKPRNALRLFSGNDV